MPRLLVAALTFLLLLSGGATPGPWLADDGRLGEVGSHHALLSPGASGATLTATRWDTRSDSSKDTQAVAVITPRNPRAVAAVANALELDDPASGLIQALSHPQRGPPSA